MFNEYAARDRFLEDTRDDEEYDAEEALYDQMAFIAMERRALAEEESYKPLS